MYVCMYVVLQLASFVTCSILSSPEATWPAANSKGYSAGSTCITLDKPWWMRCSMCCHLDSLFIYYKYKLSSFVCIYNSIQVCSMLACMKPCIPCLCMDMNGLLNAYGRQSDDELKGNKFSWLSKCRYPLFP
jgi:hypothetical protein